MKKKNKQEDWEGLADTPEEFDTAITNAVSPKEREFFEKLRYKVIHETAFSNDILLKDNENEDQLYILRIGTDDILIGQNLTVPGKKHEAIELVGVCYAMGYDLIEFLGYHITLQEWLRKRDYAGIHYNRNNDYL